MSTGDWIQLGALIVVGGAAIYGIWQAQLANDNAKDANRTAVVANDLAEQATRHAETSATAAARANEIALESNSIAAAAQAEAAALRALQTERSDVRWVSADLDGQRELRIYNRGTDDAHNVVISLEAAEWRLDERAQLVPAGGHIAFDMTGPIATEDKLRQPISMGNLRRRDQVVWGTSPLELNFRMHVVWSTALGQPRRHEQQRTIKP